MKADLKHNNKEERERREEPFMILTLEEKPRIHRKNKYLGLEM